MGYERVTIRRKWKGARLAALAIAALLCATGAWAQRVQAAPTDQAADSSVSDLVFVEGGKFNIGEWRFGMDVEGAHEVSVSSFYIAAHEVTVAEYAEFVKDGRGLTVIPRILLEFGLKPQFGQIWNGKDYETKQDATWDNPYLAQESDHPVVLVTWNDAAQYCNWLSLRDGLEEVYQADSKKSRYYIADFSKNGYRLPTEAEWEWAARGGVKSKDFDYSGANDPFTVAWFADDAEGTTHPVGRKLPNELGLYDMCGNAYEWCNDWYADYSPKDPPADPKGPDSGKSKAIRGGSWLCDAFTSIIVERSDSPANCGFNDLGFRVARASGPGTAKPIVRATTTTTTLPPKPSIPKGFVEMVAVEGGSFSLGSASGPEDARPAHKVTVNSFHIGKYEVTVGQFRKFVEVTGYVTDAERGRNAYVYDGAKWTVTPDTNWRNPHIAQISSHPVVAITWWDAVNFCNALSDADGLGRVYSIDGHGVSGDLWKNGYRLPTEAEWEYAARGGKFASATTYSGSDDAAAVAWFSLNYKEGTHPVGQKSPNALGIFDMSGGVWEWCQDRYAPYKAEDQSNPLGYAPEMKFVLRGGSWLNGKSNCAVYYRTKDEPSNTDFTFGFRVVRRP
jgi:formylglycine-generating enzyme required for sulfatase activity